MQEQENKKIEVKAQKINLSKKTLIEYFKDYEHPSEEQLSAWLIKQIDLSYYNNTFDKFKDICKRLNNKDVTEEQFEQFKEEVRKTYNIT